MRSIYWNKLGRIDLKKREYVQRLMLFQRYYFEINVEFL